MPLRHSIIAAILMISTLACLKYAGHSLEVPLNRPLSSFPRQIGEWFGREDYFDRKTYDILGVDDSFLGNYVTPDDRSLQLFVAYFQRQRQGNLPHSPQNCMPGAGWNITQTSTVELTIPGSNPRKIEIVNLTVEKHGQEQIVLYWFQSRGRFVSSEYWEKIYLVWDSLFKNRTDGSFVRLTAPVGNSEAYTVEYLRGFAQELIPILEEYIPGSCISDERPT